MDESSSVGRKEKIIGLGDSDEDDQIVKQPNKIQNNTKKESEDSYYEEDDEFEIKVWFQYLHICYFYCKP